METRAEQSKHALSEEKRQHAFTTNKLRHYEPHAQPYTLLRREQNPFAHPNNPYTGPANSYRPSLRGVRSETPVASTREVRRNR
jgi:hypothetical protein